MHRVAKWIVLMVVPVLAAGALDAKDKKRRKGRKQEESVLDQLVRECKLNEDQQARVKEKIKARDDALAKWDEANGEKVQAAEDAAREARSKDDDDLKKSTRDALRELRNARKEAASDATDAVFQVLTAEQKAAWDAYQLYQSTIARYRRVTLTEEQLARVKLACGAASSEIAELGEEGKPGKAQRAILLKLRWAIDVLVLTAEQQETLGRGPKRKGGPGNAGSKPADAN